MSEGQGTVNDHFFAEGSWNDVVRTAEGREDLGLHQLAYRGEPVSLADERDPSSQDDPSRGQQRDGLAEGERQGASSLIENPAGPFIALIYSPCHEFCGDRLGIALSPLEYHPVAATGARLVESLLPGSAGDSPARGDLVEFQSGWPGR